MHSQPTPTLERLFFIGESEDPIVLDIIDDQTMPFKVKFEDMDWEQYMRWGTSSLAVA